MSKTIKVLIVDDSSLVRKVLSSIINAQPDMEVVATCMDPYFARDKIKQTNPDVVTLDVEMPRMDGLTFLSNLMRLHPLPVVMISSLTERGADITLQAMALGAIDYISKPKIDVADGLLNEYAGDVVEKIRVAAAAYHHVTNKVNRQAVAPVHSTKPFKTTDKIIAIGASTGGTEAVADVITRLPADFPAILITQHIPAMFSASFAKRLDSNSQMNVCEARHQQPILPGHVYIAPGDKHLAVARSGAKYTCKLLDTEPVNRHKPSVEVLFSSLAKQAGQNAIAVMLTGMGKDGAQGMLEVLKAGGKTFAQDEASSVVWGMPGEAVRIGAAQSQVNLNKIPETLMRVAGNGKNR